MDFPEKILPGSFLYFPLVGLLIGAVIAGVDHTLEGWFSPPLVNICIIIFLLLFTGGLHIDGFVDTLDGFSGGRSKEEILKIMNDSRIGTMGAAGLVLLILLKFVLLGTIPLGAKWRALMVMPLAGRWAMVVAGSSCPSAKDSGLGSIFCKRVAVREWVGATVITLGVCLLLLSTWAFPFILIVFLASLVVSLYVTKRIGGMTGDTFGAINEMIEVLALFLFHLKF